MITIILVMVVMVMCGVGEGGEVDGENLLDRTEKFDGEIDTLHRDMDSKLLYIFI